MPTAHRRRGARAALLAVVCLLAFAAPALRAEEGEEEGISDNSFLVEEAYNQDPGVVQHISTWSRAEHGGAWVSTFTQEWPAGSMRHQLSYGLAVLDPGGEGSGIGDLAVNYRFQALGMEEGSRVAFAPRVSVLFATGDERRGRGAGGTGWQLALPFSFLVGDSVSAHLNVGETWVPNARDGSGDEASTAAFNLGGSVVWHWRPRLNFLLESVWIRGDVFADEGVVEKQTTFLVSPGVRWAYDFPSGLQIVPGVAFPIGVGPSDGDRSVFLYLSFEHPF